MNLLFAIIVSTGGYYEDLGNDDWKIREAAQKQLSNPLAASLLPFPHMISDPEVRSRVREIKYRYSWFQFPNIVEQRLYESDVKTWFWQYAFEGRSQWSIKGIRCVFDTYTELGVNEIREFLYFACPLPGEDDKSPSYFLDGDSTDSKVILTRRCFEFYNSTGQARRAVIGGTFHAYIP